MAEVCDELSRMEMVLTSRQPLTRSVQLMYRAGERLGFKRRVVDELVNPQEVRVFRIPCKILGKVIIFWGVMALHNNACGPFKGGVRLAADVTIWETVELARLMTLKTAVTGLEFGGGKTGIRVDMQEMYRVFERTPRDREFEKIISLDAVEYFSQAYRDTFSNHHYIPAPDMGTGPDEMAFIYNETLDPASVTGKPDGTPGWLPGRRESTGYGCCFVTLKLLREMLERDPDGATVVLQGFGNVGQPLARFLTEEGVKVVGITDTRGGAYDPAGLDVEALIEHKARTGTVGGFTPRSLTNEELLALEVDVLVPAAGGHVITADNAPHIRAKGVVEAANMPTTVEAMDILTRRGIVVIPDIVANAGGVIASMEEYSRSLSASRLSKETVFRIIAERIGEALNQAQTRAKEQGITLTEASVEIAMERVYYVMRSRRLI